MGNGSDTGGSGSPATNGNSTDDKKLDILVVNNGIKLLGESVVPGASLLLEKHIGAGLTMGAIGVLGGAAFGSMFGPLGYLLARYGASAVSFSQSMEQPPPPKDGAGTKQVVQEVRAMRNDIASVVSAFNRMAPPPVQPAPFVAPGTFAQPPAFAAAASSDLSDHIVAALRKVVPEIATATGDAVKLSVRTVMEEERTPSGRTRRSAKA